MKKVLFLLFCTFLLTTNIFAVFAGMAEGSYGYYTANGYSYYNQACITTGTDLYNIPFANAWSRVFCDASAPAGYMGSKGRLFNSSNQLVTETSFTYNSYTWTILVSAFAGKHPATYGAAYYSYGITAAYNGNGYSTYYTFKSPSQNAQ